MQSKSLLIAIAAFAVTTTGVSAYQNEDLLQAAGLSQEQIQAFEVAHELKVSGDREAARDTLLEAGIDETVLKEISEVRKEKRVASRGELDSILEAKDYQAFLTFVADKPLGDIITTEADFKEFASAHELRRDGDIEGAREIMDDLGVQPRKNHYRGDRRASLVGLTEDEREAVRVAKSANDKKAVRSILREAGVERTFR